MCPLDSARRMARGFSGKAATGAAGALSEYVRMNQAVGAWDTNPA